ncbi:helix-turn-helix domain-containing protein [Piscirickettsia salmonis]|uniref:helix-turn-helix domain-containing protein n=1 Tax=Piscirickettsia salmonis TaxID=1238 RepID=UPI003EBDB91D
MALSLAYPAKIEEDKEGNFLVSFRDAPEVTTFGETFEEAFFNAQEALELLLTDVDWETDTINNPSKQRKGEVMVAVSPEVAAPVLLHKLRDKKGFSLTEVARTMGVSYQNYQQIEAGKNITLKSLKRAAAAMGAIVEIKLHVVK